MTQPAGGKPAVVASELAGDDREARRDVVVVGASAGGVEALRGLVAGLPADLAATVLVVLHLPPGGMSALPAILSRAGPLRALPAQHGTPLRHGHVYVAPPDHHLLLLDGELALSHGPTENGHRPAIDTLFRSAARALGPRVTGIVLSGVLDDGTAGLVAIASRGGMTMVQDPQEALYPGMPLSALRHLRADHVVPVREMGTLLAGCVREPVDSHEAPPPTPLMLLEADIAQNDHDQLGGLEKAGEISEFTCPDCHGILLELPGEVRRYRCRIGHAWTAAGLLSQQTVALEQALWTALRSLEEKSNLSRRLVADASGRRHEALVDRYRNAAEEAERAAEEIRRFLLAGLPPRDPVAEEGSP